MKRTTILMILMLLFAAIIYAVTTTELITPADQYYWLKDKENITFTANASPNSVSGAIQNMTLYTNLSGSWAANYTNNTVGAVNTEVQREFTPEKTEIYINDLADGATFIWNVYSCDNFTTPGNCSWGSNRTVYVETAPTITLNAPSDGGTSNTTTMSLNATITGGASQYTCQVFSNDTGSWTSESGTNTFTNNTPLVIQKEFTQGTVIWNLRCWEVDKQSVIDFSSSNYTVTVDSTAPTVTINSPADNAYSSALPGTDGYSVTTSITMTDTNPSTCTLKVNGTDNVTATSITSGTAFDMNFNASDGDWDWNVICNDTVGLFTETSNRTITIDTTYPSLSTNKNYSGTVCDGFTVELNWSESVNSTFKYGLTTGSETFSVIDTSFGTSKTPTLTFNDSYETTFFANATSCDQAGNCNDTIPELSIISPIPLCTGWSLWSIYDTAINLSDLYTDSGADFVYWWNTSSQAWTFYSSAATGSGSFNLGIGDAVHLYESTNTTYFRNTSGVPNYRVNITSGHNYLPLYYDHTFGNLSYVQFLNSSGGNQTPQGASFQIDYYSSYNNTAQQWASFIYTWIWNNVTTLGKTPKNGLDTLWLYSGYNISVNMTGDGYVYGNWT